MTNAPIIANFIDVEPGVRVRYIEIGAGQPTIFLHGSAPGASAWSNFKGNMGAFAGAGFRAIGLDLIGYGDSSKPEGGENHIAYSKRHMALDQVEVMKALGHERFQVAGHDRGGRVVHRMLLDHPDAIERAAILDIAPTATMYARVNKEFATRYMWWFFLIQPEPLPETLIGDHLDFYLEHHIDKQNKTPGAITPDALEEYRRCYTRETLHAVCEDYRAAAGIDLKHDAEDAEKRIEIPLLALWGEKGVVGATYDVLQTWREKAQDVRGFSLPCGHYLPEEAPDLTLKAFRAFFRSA